MRIFYILENRFFNQLSLMRLCLLFLLVFLCEGVVSAQTPDTVMGKAIRILDGDTFEALMSGNITERIRLHGIDCPERNQPFSAAAKNKLADLIFFRQV